MAQQGRTVPNQGNAKRHKRGPILAHDPPRGFHPKPRSSMPPSGNARPLEGLSQGLSQEGEALEKELGQVVGGLVEEVQQVVDGLGKALQGAQNDQPG